MRIILLGFLLVLVSCGRPYHSLQSGESPTPDGDVEALTLVCKAHFQATGPGGEVESAPLVAVSSNAGESNYKLDFHDATYQVTWNKPLSTLYMVISSKLDSKLFATSTSRVPTKDHNDSMLDFSVNVAPRYYLDCEFPEYRP